MDALILLFVGIGAFCVVAVTLGVKAHQTHVVTVSLDPDQATAAAQSVFSKLRWRQVSGQGTFTMEKKAFLDQNKFSLSVEVSPSLIGDPSHPSTCDVGVWMSNGRRSWAMTPASAVAMIRARRRVLAALEHAQLAKAIRTTPLDDPPPGSARPSTENNASLAGQRILETGYSTAPATAGPLGAEPDYRSHRARRRRVLIAVSPIAVLLLVVVGIQLGTHRGRADAEAPQQPASTAASEEAHAAPSETTPEESPEPDGGLSTPEMRVPASGTWIVVLESVPKGEHDLTYALALADSVQGPGATVEVIDSDVTPGLNAGYWVVVTGDFAARKDAARECAGFGREVGGECYPRLVG